MRIPMGKSKSRQRMPKIFLDSSAFNPSIPAEMKALLQLLEMKEAGELDIVVPHSVMTEINNPSTPSYVKEIACSQIYSIEVQLNPEEKIKRERVLSVVTGNGSKEKMRPDAYHIWDAMKYGAQFFVTLDKRLLKCQGLDIFIKKPSEMLSSLSVRRLG